MGHCGNTRIGSWVETYPARDDCATTGTALILNKVHKLSSPHEQGYDKAMCPDKNELAF